ncbi:hypothetical protein MRY82_08230 [bacterium]|nr:hypothetical protein [bacterium]
MKTVTEFTGLEIKKLLTIQSQLMKTHETKSVSKPEEKIQEKVALDEQLEQNNTETSQDLQENTSPDTSSTEEDQAITVNQETSTENQETAAPKEQGDTTKTPDTEASHADEQNNQNDAAQSSPGNNAEALKPKRPSWKDRAEALRPQLLEALKTEFSWKNEDRFNLAIDASRVVNPKMQDRLRKVTALKKDKEEEKTPKFALEVGELIFLADYIIVQKEKDHRNDEKNNAKKGKKRKGNGKKKFKHKPFNDDDKKPSKRVKKPIPNPVKSNNKPVTVEKK